MNHLRSHFREDYCHSWIPQARVLELAVEVGIYAAPAYESLLAAAQDEGEDAE